MANPYGIAALCSALAVGCASSRPQPAAPHEHHDHEHDHAAAAPAATDPAAGDGPFRALAIPPANPSGPDRQVTVLLDAPDVKIVAIRLRNGVGLPEHATPVRAIIQAASGAGTVVLSTGRVHIDAGQLVTLAPGAPHSVVPDPGAELVLLVHHVRGARAAR